MLDPNRIILICYLDRLSRCPLPRGLNVPSRIFTTVAAGKLHTAKVTCVVSVPPPASTTLHYALSLVRPSVCFTVISLHHTAIVLEILQLSSLIAFGLMCICMSCTTVIFLKLKNGPNAGNSRVAIIPKKKNNMKKTVVGIFVKPLSLCNAANLNNHSDILARGPIYKIFYTIYHTIIVSLS